MYITKNYLIELSCENLIYKAKTFTDFRIIDNTVYTFRIYIYIYLFGLREITAKELFKYRSQEYIHI